jgi:hypothetical protein
LIALRGDHGAGGTAAPARPRIGLPETARKVSQDL